ncbi:hypothetical protein BJ912DRAFT_970843 [Pholiota molesta]|nr:hypothetical protein BJ912DRAFT_970843 [Pholiota molesta]
MELSEGNVLKIGSLRIVEFISVAFATCVLYDFFLKFNDEVEIVGPAFHWREIQRAIHKLRTEWSLEMFLIRVMYLIGRYVGISLQIPLVGPTPSDTKILIIGRGFEIINGFLGTVVLCATQALIALRIYRSLGPFNRMAKMVLTYGLMLEVGVLLAMQAIAGVWAVRREDNGKKVVGICSSNAFPNWLYAVWVPVLCLELVMLTLAVRATMAHRELDEILRASGTERFFGGSRVDYVPIILRDSLISLVVLLTICMVNLFGNQLFGEIVPVQTSLALSTIGSILTGSQLLTNLHQAQSNQEDEADNAGNDMELRVMFSAPPGDDSETDSPQLSRMHSSSSKDLGSDDPA